MLLNDVFVIVVLSFLLPFFAWVSLFFSAFYREFYLIMYLCCVCLSYNLSNKKYHARYLILFRLTALPIYMHGCMVQCDHNIISWVCFFFKDYCIFVHACLSESHKLLRDSRKDFIFERKILQ